MKSSKAWLWAGAAISGQMSVYFSVSTLATTRHGGQGMHAITVALTRGGAPGCAWRAGREGANRGTPEPPE
ncbi:hypothetical protein Pmi06nite_74750 [Planotetraspora mira]|uniref:Uncharacterized protein n=1 Tax=Planotetraspora mira TaxID=58121 RepID=A0A8J3TWU3_9ACTN|nr:hypothetical protein Pmi06nite_74750 [Planotetraspora mira]